VGHLLRDRLLRRPRLVTVPAPNVTLTFSHSVEALRAQEAARKAREDRMRNALEILARLDVMSVTPIAQLTRFVRATAREGLGRE
jgi:MarR-like DNA-binding transcriptional regulator SgrR of sgrS sRNA